MSASTAVAERLANTYGTKDAADIACSYALRNAWRDRIASEFWAAVLETLERMEREERSTKH